MLMEGYDGVWTQFLDKIPFTQICRGGVKKITFCMTCKIPFMFFTVPISIIIFPGLRGHLIVEGIYAIGKQ